MVSIRSIAAAALAAGAALACAAAVLLADRLTADRWLQAAFVAAVALGPGLVAVAVAHVARARQQRRATRLSELAELLQVSASESESRSLLLGYVGRVAPQAGAAVLTRVESEERLEVALGQRVAETPLRGLLVGHARPQACMALRLGRAQVRGAEGPPLAGCELCGRLPGDSVCEPLMVGHRQLGSLLVASVDSIGPAVRGELHEAVARTAPLLALQRTVAMLDRQAARDPLTGLPNRRAAHEELARLCAQAGRTVTPLAALLVDLDHFGDLNDRLGHERGDDALACVAAALAGGIRASDFVCRHGGQAFVVLAPDTARAGATALAEKLRRDVEQLTPPGVGRVTASFGVASLPEDAADGEGLLRAAERALGMAKALGRNCVATPGHPTTFGG